MKTEDEKQEIARRRKNSVPNLPVLPCHLASPSIPTIPSSTIQHKSSPTSIHKPPRAEKQNLQKERHWKGEEDEEKNGRTEKIKKDPAIIADSNSPVPFDATSCAQPPCSSPLTVQLRLLPPSIHQDGRRTRVRPELICPAQPAFHPIVACTTKPPAQPAKPTVPSINVAAQKLAVASNLPARAFATKLHRAVLRQPAFAVSSQPSPSRCRTESPWLLQTK
ncbi:hypothetical protein M0R45_026063 [Rubus argutus]|uniref:Uncharacterized protein n=1 Tax=Rubus argutus TaxID=59490 RepID=A0AAW1WYR0_RUBAR